MEFQRLRESERRASFLASASQLLASSLDYEETLRNVARMAVPDFADWCAVDVVDGTGGIRRVAVEHADPEKDELARTLQERYPPDPAATSGTPQVIRSGRSEYGFAVSDSLLESSAVDPDHLRILRAMGLQSYIAAPLSADDAVLGALVFVYAESGRRYDEADARFVEDLARRAAVAIRNAHLVREIHAARERIERQAGELEAQAEKLRLANERLADAHALAERARAEAERASEAKSEFLAVMSHELRTPMNAIVGYTDLLEAEIPGPLTEEQRRHLERVRHSTRHLVALVDQILNLARIEAGQVDLHRESVDIHGMVRDAGTLMEPLAARAGLRMSIQVDEGTLLLATDVSKVRQILLNLLSNAVKFTPDGEVTLTARTLGGEVHIEVRDTGIGIAPRDLKRIFDPFTQVDASMTRRTGGSGLGLPVSRQLARLLGGDITVESTPGQGSRFVLSLPIDGRVRQGAGEPAER